MKKCKLDNLLAGAEIVSCVLVSKRVKMLNVYTFKHSEKEAAEELIAVSASVEL